MKKLLFLLGIVLMFASSLFAENYKLYVDSVIRLSDNFYIPPDTKNKDWQEYQRWLVEGNIPVPDDLPEAIKEMIRKTQGGL
jgi:hypothetical protein